MPKTIAITPSWYWPEDIDRVAGIPPFGIHEICMLRHVRDKPDYAAIVTDEETLSYRDLARRVAGECDQLASRIPDNNRVVMNGETSLDGIIRLLAAFSMGLCTRLLGPDEMGGDETTSG
ncbi:MAG: hypothetical protein HUJ31_08080, partial [Pseudomonadales bacterium]|nr:hypothetical protein [Pseudomonadales bacterium]